MASRTNLLAQRKAVSATLNSKVARDVKSGIITKVMDLQVKYPNEFTAESFVRDAEDSFLHYLMEHRSGPIYSEYRVQLDWFTRNWI